MPVKDFIRYIFALIVTMLPTAGVRAFDTDTYAESSVLTTGNWVRVSVETGGMHLLPAATLKAMGFSDPTRVRVCGYGADRLPDRLERSTYIDDLPVVQSVATPRGVYFYATGPVSYTRAGISSQLTVTVNPFTTKGYYYVTDSDLPARTADVAAGIPDMGHAERFNEIVYHKAELYNAGETGHTLLGEDFLLQPTQTFTFSLPDRVEGTPGWLECSFWAMSGASSRVVLSVNDNALSYTSDDQIKGSTEHYTHGVESLTRKTFDLTGDKARVSVTHSRSANASLARLNHLVVNYERRLALTKGVADFWLDSTGGSLAGATADTRVWDVTDPLNIREMQTVHDGGTSLTWNPAVNGMRHYVAWQDGATLPSPKTVGGVPNQDLHAREVPDMVIFTHPDWLAQARRVADLHSTGDDALDVLVVTAQEVYNEFSSGSPDANALRKLLKMYWDRTQAGAPGGKLRYALIMGRSTFDNRRITPTIKALQYPTLPCWQTDNSFSDNSSYTTDDVYAMLLDGAGANMAADYQCIAVGRMPVVSASDAANVVDKLYEYVNRPINSAWKHRALMVADDENRGLFMEHTEAMVDAAAASPGGERVLWNKVYLDAYEKQNGTYPGARGEMFRALTEGVVWWNFAGHANPTSWTGDGLMTYTDINNLYLKHYPFVLAATCDFLRWDASQVSAAEILYRTQSSGIIGAISATRPAFIDRNGELMARCGPHMFAVDSHGRNLTIGEIYRRTKNGSAGNGTWSDDNKLRYVLMGDPAMRLCVPGLSVRLDAVNGTRPDADAQVTLMAGQDVTLEGTVTDADGSVMADFDGKIYITLYDAEYSTTSHGWGEQGKEVTYEQQGARLQAVNAAVQGGRFEVHMVMPGEIANNFRPAALSMYAVADDNRDAIGVNRDLYVFGYDENAIPDDVAPVIEAFYLNHSTFADGGTVNTTPVAIAHVSDNRSINLSSAGIGHQMLLSIDGRSLTDTPLYYTPRADGTPGGTLVYQLEELAPGEHSLRLRVWDTSGNSASQTITFTVGSDVAPTLYDMYADANPADTDTRFYLVHDRPDERITVNIEVVNLLGRTVWTHQITGMSETLRSFPVTWNLTDNSGRRVGRGIYLYRATVTDAAGLTSGTRTRRIAVR